MLELCIIDHSQVISDCLLGLYLDWFLTVRGFSGFGSGSGCFHFGVASNFGVDVEQHDESDVDETHDEYSLRLDLEA